MTANDDFTRNVEALRLVVGVLTAGFDGQARQVALADATREELIAAVGVMAGMYLGTFVDLCKVQGWHVGEAWQISLQALAATVREMEQQR